MSFEYYEYKYLIPESQVAYVKQVLSSLAPNLDPYPEGWVNSIYFDSLDQRSTTECANGEALKRKFRLRFYGKDNLSKNGEIQVKEKNLYAVSKYKQKLSSELKDYNWPQDTTSKEIQALSSLYPNLAPLITVKYLRNRYRFFDTRITLDSKISVEAAGDRHFDRVRREFQIPATVLEIKTTQERPFTPLLNLIDLKQSSFSKFYAGVQCLQGNSEWEI